MTTLDDRELIRLRSMTVAEKLRVTEALWRQAQQMVRAAVADQHPEWSAEQVANETRRRLSGERR